MIPVAVDVQDHVGRAFDESVVACVLAIAEEALAARRVRHVDDLDDALSSVARRRPVTRRRREAAGGPRGSAAAAAPSAAHSSTRSMRRRRRRTRWRCRQRPSWRREKPARASCRRHRPAERRLAEAIQAFQWAIVRSVPRTINPAATPSRIECSWCVSGIGSLRLGCSAGPPDQRAHAAFAMRSATACPSSSRCSR